jgi:hypothetical protein
MKEYRDMDAKINEHITACFIPLVTGVYLSERVLLVVGVRFSESIVGYVL